MPSLTPQVEMANRAAVVLSGLTLDLDVTTFLVLALIILPFVILNGLVFKPFIKLFEERHDRIEGAAERANVKLEEAENKAAQFEEEMEAAKRRGVEVRDNVRSTTQAAIAKKIAEEQAIVDERLEAELKEIDRAKQSAMTTVNVETRRLAEFTASKLLGRRI